MIIEVLVIRTKHPQKNDGSSGSNQSIKTLILFYKL